MQQMNHKSRKEPFTEMEVISTRGYPSMTFGRWDHRNPRHQKVGHNQLNTHATLPVGFTANSIGSAAKNHLVRLTQN